MMISCPRQLPLILVAEDALDKFFAQENNLCPAGPADTDLPLIELLTRRGNRVSERSSIHCASITDAATIRTRMFGNELTVMTFTQVLVHVHTSFNLCVILSSPW